MSSDASTTAVDQEQQSLADDSMAAVSDTVSDIETDSELEDDHVSLPIRKDHVNEYSQMSEIRRRLRVDGATLMVALIAVVLFACFSRDWQSCMQPSCDQPDSKLRICTVSGFDSPSFQGWNSERVYTTTCRKSPLLHSLCLDKNGRAGMFLPYDSTHIVCVPDRAHNTPDSPDDYADEGALALPSVPKLTSMTLVEFIKFQGAFNFLMAVGMASMIGCVFWIA